MLRIPLQVAKVSAAFTEPGSSSPCSQQPANGTDLEPINAIHTFLSHFVKIHFNNLVSLTLLNQGFMYFPEPLDATSKFYEREM
jgi:hypothetical protein